LEETYQAALDRIEKDGIGMRALTWVTYTKRHLKAGELQHALAVEPTTVDIDEDDLNEVSDLVSRCAGLVTFDLENDIFRLVHYTTHTFLQDRLQADGNAEIAMTCLRYLSFPAFANCFHNKYFLHSCLKKYKLANYAAKNWFVHLRGPSEIEFHSRILETFGAQGTRDSVFQIMLRYHFILYDSWNVEPGISLLLLASLCGLSSMCCKILDESPDNGTMYAFFWSLN
jgi:hypothetical protein